MKKYKIYKNGKKIATTNTVDTAIYLAEKFECTVYRKIYGNQTIIQSFEKPSQKPKSNFKVIFVCEKPH